MISNHSDVEAYITQLLQNRSQRCTNVDLTHQVRHAFPLSIRQVNGVIHQMVDAGLVEFTYEHGCTFIDLAFNKPVRISPRIVFVPAGTTYHPASGERTVIIEPGASFGTGRHSTSRLAVRGIDTFCHYLQSQSASLPRTVLDVGTGSGILIIAAIRLGCHRGLGIDLDSVARYEARRNVQHNGLVHQIRISAKKLEEINGHFDMVIANLRMPSLIRYVRVFHQLLMAGGGLVLSGIRIQEKADLSKAFTREGLVLWWEADQNDWQGLVFTKR